MNRILLKLRCMCMISPDQLVITLDQICTLSGLFDNYFGVVMVICTCILKWFDNFPSNQTGII